MIEEPRYDFYHREVARDAAAIQQLANHEDCLLFHAAARFKTPLIVIEGKQPLGENSRAR